MKKLWLNIKAVCIVILAFSVTILMTFVAFIYSLAKGFKKMRVTKDVDE